MEVGEGARGSGVTPPKEGGDARAAPARHRTAGSIPVGERPLGVLARGPADVWRAIGTKRARKQ